MTETLFENLGVLKLDLKGAYTHKVLKRLFRMTEMSNQELADQLKQPLSVIEEIMGYKEIAPKRLHYLFERGTCPYCLGVILSGEIGFATTDDDNRKKEQYGFCIHCRQPLMFVFEKSIGLTEVKKVQPISVVNDYAFSSGSGVQRTTACYIQKCDNDDSYEARVGIAVMGSVNFDSCRDACPFDPNYHDNYCKGVGKTLQEALKALNDDLCKMRDMLFA